MYAIIHTIPTVQLWIDFFIASATDAIEKNTAIDSINSFMISFIYVKITKKIGTM